MKTQAPTVEENTILASVIAIKMGATWTPQKNVSWWGFGIQERTTGKGLWFRYDDGKWGIHCELPKDKRNLSPWVDEKKFPKPSCNVSANKTPDQIVKDIQRRILPEYEPLFNEVKRVNDLHNASYDHHDQVKKHVEETLGLTFRPDYHEPTKTSDDLYFDKIQHKCNFKVEVVSGKIKLECTFENEQMGLEILKQIQDQL